VLYAGATALARSKTGRKDHPVKVLYDVGISLLFCRAAFP